MYEYIVQNIEKQLFTVQFAVMLITFQAKQSPEKR
jgi:hypothetical protein